MDDSLNCPLERDEATSETGLMAFSPKVRVLYWLTCIPCWLGLQLLGRLMFKSDGSPLADVFAQFLGGGALVVALIVAGLVCRAVGFSLSEKTETQLQSATDTVVPTVAELRSYSAKNAFMVLAGTCFVGSALIVLVTLFLKTRTVNSNPGWIVAGVEFALVGLAAGVAYLKRNGSFLARADENGVEIQSLAQRNRRDQLSWSQIASAVQVEHRGIIGDFVQIEFRDKEGQSRAQVPLHFATPEQQQQFTQVVTLHLSH